MLIAVFALHFLVSKRILVKSAVLSKSSSEAYGKTQHTALESLNGYYAIRFLRKNKYFVNRYDAALTHGAKINGKLNVYAAILNAFYTLLNYTLPLCVAILAAFLSANNLLSIGSIFLMYLLAGQLRDPVFGISSDIQNILTNNKIFERFIPIINQPDDIGGSQEIADFDSLDVAIDKFNYNDNEHTILNNFSLQIKRGEKVAIMGESGCGKSTVLNMIAKKVNLSETQGKIRINGINSADINNESLYKNIAYLTQSSILFSGTLKENICLGDEFTQQEFDEIIKICALEDFVTQYGENREIGENANNISGGQLQRICLARILIRKPRLLLLDEPTASLDEESSLLVIQSLKNYLDKYNISMLVSTHKSDILAITDTVISI